ncbi:hypothetical protein EJB05_52539, partial [Eragrostis curvula]
MDMPVLYSCLFLALLLLPLVILKARKANGHGGAVQRLPPGPWRLPVIGSLLHLLGNPHVHRAMADLARRHGDAPLMYLKLGEVPVVVASSPDAAREILVTRSASFASRPERRALRALISDDGAGLASAPYGAHWRQLRRTCVLELLSARRVRSLRRVREQEVARLLAAVAGAAGDDVAAAVNVSERADVMVAEATVRAMMGDGFERRGEYLDGIAEVRELFLGFDLGDLFPSSRLAGFVCGTARRAEAIRRKMFELMDCAIGQHQEQQIRSATDDDDEEDFLEVLLRLQREGGYEIPLTMAGVKDIILDLFLAGTETTTATIQWAMSELMRNPRVLHKVQAELRDKLQGRWTVTDDDLPGLHCLKLVIKETLRLHPAAPMLIRECGEEACKVLGYDVPKGARVLVNAWAINRDPRHWGADAETFRPERFEDGGGAVDFTGKDMELIPFGAGRRMCPGVAFAHATVELALAAMLYHFDWELPAGVAPREVDMEEAPGIVVGRKNDLYLHPVVRVPRAALAISSIHSQSCKLSGEHHGASDVQPLRHGGSATPQGQAVNVSKRIATVIAVSAMRPMIGDRFKRRDEFLVLLEEGLKLVSGFNLGDLFPSSRLMNFVSGTAWLAHDNHKNNFELVESAIKQHEERKAAANGSVEEEDLY